MVDLLLLLGVSSFVSFVAMPGVCCFLRVTRISPAPMPCYRNPCGLLLGRHAHRGVDVIMCIAIMPECGSNKSQTKCTVSNPLHIGEALEGIPPIICCLAVRPFVGAPPADRF